jgi:hypothetical protein
MLRKLANVGQINHIFSSHPLDVFPEKAVIQDPGFYIDDNVQDSRQKFSKDYWQCFQYQNMPTEKAVSLSHVELLSPPKQQIHELCQASQVLRMCSALPSLFFQTRFSLAKKVFQF